MNAHLSGQTLWYVSYILLKLLPKKNKKGEVNISRQTQVERSCGPQTYITKIVKEVLQGMRCCQMETEFT